MQDFDKLVFMGALSVILGVLLAAQAPRWRAIRRHVGNALLLAFLCIVTLAAVMATTIAFLIWAGVIEPAY